jgi:hypothetical protein
MIEYKHKRTPYSKTYHIDLTTKRLLISMRQLHYYNEGKLTEINLRPQIRGNSYFVETPYYYAEVIKFPFEIKINGYSIRNLDSPQTLDIEVVEDGLRFKPFDNTTFYIYFRPEGVEIFKNSPLELTWKIEDEIIRETGEPRIGRMDFDFHLRDYKDIIEMCLRGIYHIKSFDFKNRNTVSPDIEDNMILEVIYGHPAW